MAVIRRASPPDCTVMRVEAGEITLEVDCLGDPGAPPLLFLHGFPEHRVAWRKVANALAEKHYCILPDLRGYGQSGRPKAETAYGIEKLLSDVDALVAFCGPQVPTLIGHDWGGILAWYYAAQHPDRIAQLVVANAPHPALFQRRLIDHPAQRLASQYITRLRSPDAAQTSLAAGASGLWDRLFGQNPAYTPADRAAYIASWEVPGAIEAMLNWYCQAPFVVPAPGEASAMPAWAVGNDLVVNVPVLILWGMADQVLLPCLLDGLSDVAPAFQLECYEGASHAIIHELPALLADQIAEFCMP